MPKKKKTGKKKSKAKRVVIEPSRPVDPIPPLPPLPPQPSYGESIRDILMGSKVIVTEKEYLGVKLSSKILDQLTPQEIRDLKTVFDAFSNRRGRIDAVALQRAMRGLGFKITRSDAREMIRDVDVDRSGTIEFNEFLEFVIQHQGSAQDIHDEIKQGFQMFDFDGTGQLTLDNLKLACKETGVKFTEQELKDMIEEADTNGDNQVDQEDFINVMLKTNLF